jgi:hypothetical protein
MVSVNNISGSSYLPLLSSKSLVEMQPVVNAKISFKPSAEEVYITSCRPTRLSMELIANIRKGNG